MTDRLDGPGGSAIGRRGFLLGTGVAAAGLAAACSSGSSDSKASRTPNTGAFPVTVDGKPGPATVKSAPKRVVAAGYLRDLDLALALDASLVGLVKNANFGSGTAPWQRVPSDVTRLDAAVGTLPFEKIAGLQLDLILAADDFGLQKDFATLSKIAPTLASKTSFGQDSWQTLTQRAGQVLGRTARAEQVVTDVEAAYARTRSKYPQLKGKTFTFVAVMPGDKIFTTSRATAGNVPFFQQTGMVLSPKVSGLPQSSTPGRSPLSIEQLGLVDADVVIFSYISAEQRARFEKDPLVRQLGAVRRGSYVPLSLNDALALGFASPLTIPYALSRIGPRIAVAATKAG